MEDSPRHLAIPAIKCISCNFFFYKKKWIEAAEAVAVAEKHILQFFLCGVLSGRHGKRKWRRVGVKGADSVRTRYTEPGAQESNFNV